MQINNPSSRCHGITKVIEGTAKNAKNAKVSYFLGVLRALCVEKKTKYRFTLDFGKAIRCHHTCHHTLTNPQMTVKYFRFGNISR